jgi:triacylglycerol lipase
VLVHGIWDSAARLAPLRLGLALRGVERAHAIDLIPNDGRATIAELGLIVAREAAALAERESVARVDIVGFSMGALVSRWYIQRGGGQHKVRRFVSISGPHQGTATAYALSLPGIRDMRPRSDLLRDLAADPRPLETVETHCVYTPFDLTVLPARSAILPEARSVRSFPVLMHRFMISNDRVIDHVAALLLADDAKG